MSLAAETIFCISIYFSCRSFSGCERLPIDHSQHGWGEDHGLAEVQAEDGKHGHLEGQLQPRVDGQRANLWTFFAQNFKQKEERTEFWFR
jgi:hypothetical protein